MTPKIEQQLEIAQERFEEITILLSDPEVMNNQNKFRDLSKEYAHLEPLVNAFRRYQEIQNELQDAQDMLADKELKELAQDSIKENEVQLADIDQEINILLVPKDPNDDKDIYLEVRAGTGGDEAAIFAGDLFRMYSRFAEKQNWQVEIVSVNEGEHGGYKEIIALIKGRGVYGQLKFESGTHRVQRVPETESQGRVHTSACTVAILPVVDQVNSVTINPADIRIDTFRSSGAGGQHVNTTDSAVRITHLPTNTVVECQDERSQHKNKAKAMSLLASRILAAEQAAIHSEQSEQRKLQVGSGDRSQRIRTYNYPQGRITDHRINLTLYQLQDIIAGQLSDLIDPLNQAQQADLLAQLGH